MRGPARILSRMPDRRPDRGLLDTSVVIDLERIEPSQLPLEVAVSAITMAELAAGPHATPDPEERARRQDRLQRAEAAFDPLPFDTEASRAYGRSMPPWWRRDARREAHAPSTSSSRQRHVPPACRSIPATLTISARSTISSKSWVCDRPSGGTDRHGTHRSPSCTMSTGPGSPIGLRCVSSPVSSSHTCRRQAGGCMAMKSFSGCRRSR